MGHDESAMTSLSGARVTASLLDALVEMVDAAGESAATNALVGRLGERIARSLADDEAGRYMGSGAVLAARIEDLAGHLIPGSRLLRRSPADVADAVSVCFPPCLPSGPVDLEPPTRIRLVASALRWLAAQATDAPTGPLRPDLDLRLIDGDTCWVQTICLRASDAAGPGEIEHRRDAQDARVVAHRRADLANSGKLAQPLSELAASVAHGLNNLLGAVAGQSSLLLDAADEADAVTVRASGLRLIHQAALDGAGLAQRLLRASRGEPVVGPSVPDMMAHVDLGRVLLDAVELTRLRWHDEARQRGIDIEVAVDVSQPLLIRGMAADLREIMVNLILNAVDAMPAGGQLRLCGDLQDGIVTVRCQDSGLGMAPDVLARVFEPFFSTKGSAGTGMGMAILYSVVARHGGDVRVSSVLGEGTTVTLHVPAAHLSHAEGGSTRFTARGEPSELVDLGPDLHACDVLVVEDDPSFRAIFARRLALDARRVEAVADAHTALMVLESGHWDLVCIDEGLPDVSGRQLAAEIHRRGLAGAVILVTGAATGPDDPLLASAGVDAVLPKPCSDAELARAVRAAAGRLMARVAASA
jgi:two-component system cell cycle sensor histidine kinase/response regulator CckA